VASFDLIRHHRANESMFLYAFDLIEPNGDGLGRDPLEVRKATLASIVAKASPGIRFNESIWRATARPFSPMPARSGGRLKQEACRSSASSAAAVRRSSHRNARRAMLGKRAQPTIPRLVTSCFRGFKTAGG
jgi:ATP-dependent DNA ligase